MEEPECPVCLRRYSRGGRVPRSLHCRHTFCGPCLERLAEGGAPGLLTVLCPLCRWITCLAAERTLPGALYVDTAVWDRLEDEPPAEPEDEPLPPATQERPGVEERRFRPEICKTRLSSMVSKLQSLFSLHGRSHV